MPLFKQSLVEFFSSKTNWAGMTTVILALVGAWVGEYNMQATVTQVMAGLAMLFVRDAIAGMPK